MSDSDAYQQIKKSLQIIEQQLAAIYQIIDGHPSDSQGVIGVFDGEFMVSDDGKKYQIPPNYASKSMLVVGDKVKMVEDANGGQAKFKQIDKVERVKLEGVLARKDGKYEVLTDIGSFKVLPVAVKHYNGESGDRVKIQIPKNYTKGGWAAFEKVLSDTSTEIIGVPQVLLSPAAPAAQDAHQPTSGSSSTPASDQTVNTSEKNSDSGSGKKSKSRKRKKKNSGESSGAGRSPEQKANTPKPIPATENKTAQEPTMVEVPFDEDDLV